MRLRNIEKKWDMTQNTERKILEHEFVSHYMRFFIHNCFLLLTYIHNMLHAYDTIDRYCLEKLQNATYYKYHS